MKPPSINKTSNQRKGSPRLNAGFAALFVAVLIFAVVFGIGVSVFISTYGEQKIVKNTLDSSLAYYSAEAGVEDALLRLVKKWSLPASYNLSVGDSSAAVAISDIIGGSRTIVSLGDIRSITKKIQAIYEISQEKKSFFYGAQVGEGGLDLDNLSKINGNVFSNGSVIAEAGTEITGTVKVAKTGNKIAGAIVSGGDALADICESSNVSGTLTANIVTGCTAASIETLGAEIPAVPLSISSERIDSWKTEAASGGILSGDFLVSGSDVVLLGPQKIEGNLLVQNNAKIVLTGTLWVTGNVTVKNNSTVELDSGYASLSGLIISDGVIALEDNSISSGSGVDGSYLMYISTSLLNPAIIVKNNAQVDIVFTDNGWIELQNNTKLREISGYGIHLKNNAEIVYEVGLQDVSFSSGPGGSWEVASWREVE